MVEPTWPEGWEGDDAVTNKYDGGNSCNMDVGSAASGGNGKRAGVCEFVQIDAGGALASAVAFLPTEEAGGT